MTKAQRDFVRGFAVAVAETLRHHVNAEDLLNDISATESMLREAGVEEYDLVELRPVLRRLRERKRKRPKWDGNVTRNG